MVFSVNLVYFVSPHNPIDWCTAMDGHAPEGWPRPHPVRCAGEVFCMWSAWFQYHARLEGGGLKQLLSIPVFKSNEETFFLTDLTFHILFVYIVFVCF